MRREMDRWDGLTSSALMRVEALRACARYGADYVERADAGLGAFTLVPIDDAVLGAAVTLRPPELRSLDAIHLATALSLGDDLGVLIAYDHRLQDAAAARRLNVAAPA